MSLPLISSLILALSSPYVYAATTSGYKIFVDAGSTSSRIHLFQYTQADTETPVINELFTESVKPPLASFANDPQDAGASLKKLFDDVSAQLQAKGVTSPVPVNVFATAGMRLLPVDQQSPIYHDVTAYLHNHYTLLTPGDIETIPGQMEGLYDWLGVNYLEGSFQKHQVTTGALDMGGASTQLAFEAVSSSKDMLMVTVNGQVYSVYSISFLGLGQDQARSTMGNSSLATACYPPNYPMNGNAVGAFNYANCQLSYAQIIADHHVDAQVIPTAAMKFIAFSGIYYDYQFFMPDLVANQPGFETQIKTVCAETWSQLQAAYPAQSAAYLSTYCANGVYVDHLLYDSYHLTDPQLTFASKINNQSIDWTLGAALYSLIV